MSVRLQVNVDHIATVRQARGVSYPDPVVGAALAELAGADGITIHLREDRRHIQDRDLKLMRETVQSRLNLEMAATDEMVAIAYDIKPDLVTLVPEKREERTTEGGLDLVKGKDLVGRAISDLGKAGIPVSLFIDPNIEQVKVAHRVSAACVEFHTGYYCDAKGDKERLEQLERLKDMAKAAGKLGMAVAGGHGLNYHNVVPVARIQEMEELNIGHSIIARAVMVGMDRAVREMIELIRFG